MNILIDVTAKISRYWPNDKEKVPFIETIKWKMTFVGLLFKTCYECKITDNKIHFLPILRYSLCAKCAKLPKYQMISEETAELDLNVSKREITDSGIKGLKMYHSGHTGIFTYMYYIKDLIPISKIKNYDIPDFKGDIRELRRAEIVYSCKEQGITNLEFIRFGLDIKGGWPDNYVNGKSTMTAHKVALKMKSQYPEYQRQYSSGRIKLPTKRKLEEDIVLVD